jgi:DNA-binding XRE family transcriptional regulator
MYQPDELTAGERFTLWMRRNDLTAERAAALNKVAVATILNWKADRGRVPLTPLERITKREGIFIARRRLGYTRAQMADLLGCSEATLDRAETETSGPGYSALALALKYFTTTGWPQISRPDPA